MKQRIRITIAAIAITAGMAAAAVTSDYFDYGDTPGSLVSFTTSDTAGWGANGWSGSANPYYQTAGLTFSTPNGVYVNTQTGGKLIGQAAAGTVTRALDPALSGTVWMSVIFSGTFWNASLDLQHSKILINGSANDYFGVMTYGFAQNARWRVVENGVVATNDLALGVSANGGGLVVARLRTNYSGTDDDIALWVLTNGTSTVENRTVAALGTPVYETSTTHDIWGDSIASLGIAIKSARDQNSTDQRWHWVDSLRISSGMMSDDEHVYEIFTGVAVPEPAAVMLGLAGLLGLVRRSRR